MSENLENKSELLHRLDWYQDAKFGLFIHWGAYSAAGAEASWPIMAPDLAEVMFKIKKKITEEEYRSLPGIFNPVDFNAEEWVRIAQQAGVRYIIFTAKHHDGFCMFDAPDTDYKVTNTPFGRDICLELSKACASAGMRLGFYYSPPDMHDPNYRDTRKPATENWLGEPGRKEWADYLNTMEKHLRKLLTDYGNVSVIWFDGLVNHGKYDPFRFHKLIHDLSPDTLINDRLGDGYDFVTPEQFIPKNGIPVRNGKPPSGMDPGGDNFFRTIVFLYKLPVIRGWLRTQLEKYSDGSLELTPVVQEPYPSPERFQPWETCMTMGRSWAFNPDEAEWKAPEKLLKNLVDIVSRGGNYLLNVGPTSDGVFPPQAKERLEYIGKWIEKNGESVYGSTYTPQWGFLWGQATRKGKKLYLHIYDWPADNKLKFDFNNGRVKSVRFLHGGSLEFIQDEKQIEILLPPQFLNIDITVILVELLDDKTGWNKYSPVTKTTVSPFTYMKNQMIASAVINSLINGVIAFFAFHNRGAILLTESYVDILITVAIISFLVSWVAINSARSEFKKGNLDKPSISLPGLPEGVGLRSILITFICTFIFGGFILGGLLSVISPGGLSNWGYIITKIIYTGVSAALAAFLAMMSVFVDESKN